MHHRETHRFDRIGWLRAAVLGANDGIVSTASLILGVAAAGQSNNNVAIAGMAGLVAGAMSMAAGEYISVSSQADTEAADLARERRELATDLPSEKAELAGIYVSRGLDSELARQVADQLMAHDALGAHMRDELGMTEMQRARPVLAAVTSAGSFAVGAALPLLVAVLVRTNGLGLVAAVLVTSLGSLALLGWISARIGGAGKTKSVTRVMFWGALAMAITYAVGALFGAVV